MVVLISIVTIPIMRYPPAYNKKAGSPISKNSHTPAKNKTAAMIGSGHNCLMFVPANTPHTAANIGLTAKNNRKHMAIPFVPAKVTASQGQPIIRRTVNIVQVINFFIEIYSSISFKFTNVSYSFQTWLYILFLVHQPLFHNTAAHHYST